jgi:hypothetical protein
MFQKSQESKMKSRDPQTSIKTFTRNIKIFWQMVFLTGVLSYGVSFLYRLQVYTNLKNIELLKILNWASFIIAVFMAFYILHIKRTYFRLGYFRQFLEKAHKNDPELNPDRLIRKLMRDAGNKYKRVWVLGLIIILIGVVYFWLTFDAMNMHIYFVVGLYSLVINYPRTELFIDIPYIIEEIFQQEPKAGESSETEEKNS